MSFPYGRPRWWGLSRIDPLARELKCKPNEVEARLVLKLPPKADIKAKEKEINQIQIEQKS